MPGGTKSAWRAEDEILLQRLEDELVCERLFAFMTQGLPVPSNAGDNVGKALTPAVGASARCPPRMAGLVAELRKLPGGADAVARALVPAELIPLARLIGELAMDRTPPVLLHHLAVFHTKAARALERSERSTHEAATAWVRALAAWLALAAERSYLEVLEEAVLAADAGSRGRANDARIPPERVPLEWLASVGARAEATARSLAPPGRAALLALRRTDEAARLACAPDALARVTRAEAERHRNSAVEGALAVISDSLDEANVRGELTTSGGALLHRALDVWAWTSNDAMVEQFIVDRVEKIGWDLYRAKRWEDLATLIAPFRSVFESFATRIATDPTQLAYASACAQMFVFTAELERTLPRKLEAAERALVVCPTHRNGRLVLASALCDQAMDAMRRMDVFTPRPEVVRVEALLVRAESLYPQSSTLPGARRMLKALYPNGAGSDDAGGAGDAGDAGDDGDERRRR